MEITSWSKRYEDLKSDKTTMEQEGNNLRKLMESNHDRAVEELENLYEKKLAFENDKFLQLERELHELKRRQEAEIKEIERKHELTVRTLEN